jgi:hypothetical protein
MGKTQRKSSEKGLMPNALIISTVDGQELIVPADKEENAIANKILAAQIRQQIQTNIKRYKDSEELLTPKQLLELAQAAHALQKFSGDVYQGSDPMANRPDNSGPTEVKVEEVSFDKLNDKPAGESDTPSGG